MRISKLPTVIQRAFKICDVGHVCRRIVLGNGVRVWTIDEVRSRAHRNPDVVRTCIIHIPVNVVLRHIGLYLLGNS